MIRVSPERGCPPPLTQVSQGQDGHESCILGMPQPSGVITGNTPALTLSSYCLYVHFTKEPMILGGLRVISFPHSFTPIRITWAPWQPLSAARTSQNSLRTQPVVVLGRPQTCPLGVNQTSVNSVLGPYPCQLASIIRSYCSACTTQHVWPEHLLL